MTDDQLRPVVDDWLKTTDAPPPDPVGSVHLAMANVRRTRQLGRWWPLSITARLSSPARQPPGEELSTATRALFSIPRLLAGATVLALIAGLLWSGLLTPPQDRSPGVEAEQVEFIVVTGTSTISAGPSPAGDDAMSDPRVSGHANLINNYLIGDEDNTGTQWGAYRLANDDGSWEGEWIGFYEPPGDEDEYGTPGTQNAMAWASGTGEYEGWTYVANYTGHLLGLDVKGLLYQGDIPPTVALGLLDTKQE